MKVALCTISFPELTLSLARGLEQFCDPTVLLPEEHLQTAADFRPPLTFPYRASAGAASKLFACATLAFRLAAIKADIIHFQGWSPLLTPFLPLFRRSQIVFSWHDPVPHSGEENWPMDVTQNYLVKHAKRIVVLSKAMQTVAARLCPSAESRIRVVHHGVLDYYLEGAEDRPLQIDVNDKFVLFFGRVSPYKGVEDLCQAFSMMRTRDHKLVIAGKHLYKVSIPEDERQRIVVLNQFIPNEVLRYLFRHCSLVVLPYRDATQSGVLMMAYAFAKPVVATQVGGIPEMIEEGLTGITVPAQNPGLLSSAIDEVLGKPETLERMGERGWSFAEQNFNWSKIAEETMAVYREAVSGSS